jgi:four helix bundle protein
MATIEKFEDIKAWQKARIFSKNIFLIGTTTRLEKDFKLRDQINASSGSVMDNIAEGFGRGGNNEFIQFLEVAHASACESQSQLYQLLDRGYIDEGKFSELYNMAAEIKRMILGLVDYLNSSPIAGPKFKDRVKQGKN